ncbi:kinase-like domain-containing protein [Pisolithus orientalis]|uniref:kinase-like domain-containing protein n=1 Tax=Pisolithus orientalis TaxID=936130 RepID=UPI0022246A94|nr:kinase-like domain-containing protein [Pisolithus orientalis]KAI6000345.1 kinase-like domain-containing protein [Pisolithus orientalis]
MSLGNAYTYVQATENDPRPLLEDIASGLYYLHSHDLGPVIHGDLKGPNVLVSSDRRALLTDFGLATLNVSTFNMTVDAIRGGSCHWMAPELLDDCPASIKSDVWAFGMTTLVILLVCSFEQHLFYS